MSSTRHELTGLASPPATADADEALDAAAQRMQASHIGSLVVLERGAPVGLVTDRDIALAACLAAPGAELPRVGAIASRPLVTLPESATLAQLTELCAARCIRRVGLVDGDGRLVGIVSTDTVVQALGRDLGELARTLERQFEAERAPAQRGLTFGPE